MAAASLDRPGSRLAAQPLSNRFEQALSNPRYHLYYTVPRTVAPAAGEGLQVDKGSVIKHRRYPLQVLLSVLFSTLVLAAGLGVAWRGYAESRAVALAAAEENFIHVGRQAQSELHATLDPAGSLAELLALHPLAQARNLSQRLQALPLLRHALSGRTPLAAVYAGYEDGSFFLLRPMLDPFQRERVAAPPASSWLVQSIETDARGGRQVSYLFFDDALLELERRVGVPYALDPRSRPWFERAITPGQRVLSDPYVFFTTEAPGMTVSVRSPAGSVIGVDVTLESLSDLLSGLRTLPVMRVALFDSQRHLLARAFVNQTLVRREGDQLKLATIDQFGLPLAALQPVGPAAAPVSRDIDAHGVIWKTVVLPVETQGSTLSLAVGIPLDILLERAREIRNWGLITTLLVLAIMVPLTAWVAHKVSDSLRRITRQAADIQAFSFDGPSAGESPVLEIEQLARTVDMMRATIRNFLDIAASLAAEPDLSRLLDRVVNETSKMMGAAGGIAFLPDEQGVLRSAAVAPIGGAQNRSVLPVPALEPSSPIAQAFDSGSTVVATIAPGTGGALDFLGELWPEESFVLTAIPLLDRAREKVGVLALFQRGTEPPSKARLAFAETLSGTAAVAIETRRLLAARKELLDAFIRLIAGAIDAKSRYTGGHCARVPELTQMLAEAACEVREGPYRDFTLDAQEWEAVQIASWLHDCGKVTTPEYVVDKATKLEALHDRLHEVRMRFEVLKRDAEIAYWKSVAEGADREAGMAGLRQAWEQLDEEFAFVAACNEGGEYMDPERVERLRTIAARTWQRTLDDRIGLSQDEKARKARQPAQPLPVTEALLADKPEHRLPHADADLLPDDNPWGFKLQVPEYKFDRGELHNLSVGRGTLTEEDRYAINHHIVQTIVMLSQLPFPKHLRQVPELAGAHHETMDGRGYPRRLRREEMSPVARMMAIADIFEALTAADRPYKKAKKLSEALAIMAAMTRDQHIDAELFELFLRSGVYRRYAERFLQPEQIDLVEIEPLLATAAGACR